MSWYKTGTLSVTNNSPTVAGASTLWVDVGTLNAGDMILIGSTFYEILSIQSNTGLTLASNFLGSTASGLSYAIIPIGLLPSALAQQVKSTLTTANAALASAVLSTAAQGLTSTQQGNARANIGALGAADVGSGRLSKSVAGGTDVTLTATEAANQFIELTGTLTGNINVVVPAAARLWSMANLTSGAYTLTVKTAAGTGVALAGRMLLECDGTNVVNPLSLIGQALPDGTANSVPYLNGSKVLTSGGVLAFDGANLGIGASSPREKLDVTGNIATDFSDNRTIQFQYLTGSNYGLGMMSDATGRGLKLFSRASDGTGYIGFYTGSMTQRMLLDYSGNLGVGVTPSAWNSSYKALDLGSFSCMSSKSVGTGGYIFGNAYLDSVGYKYYSSNPATRIETVGGAFTFSVAPAGTAGGAITFATLMQTNATAATTGANAAASVLSLNKETTTSRSINAAGTINASGADYAEYERNGGLTISKGSVVGFKADGKLTLTFSEAIRFGVKSTNPSLVGGDTWGAFDQIGDRPIQPTFTPPEYAGSRNPGEAPVEPVLPETPTPEQQAEYDVALENYTAAKATYDKALYIYNMDQAEYEARVYVAQNLFDIGPMQTYQTALVEFEARLEVERQLVDRVAYSGKVPVNVLGAVPGDYVVAQATAAGNIEGIAIADPDFAQYKKAVGRVNRILPDGRAEVAVIIH